MITWTDEDLQRMRTDTENNWVERKTTRAKPEWLKAAVAFANSTPIELTAVLFIGVNDDGTFERVNKDHDWEKQQKTVSEELSRAYPPLSFQYKYLHVDDEGECLAVIIPGSLLRPHFCGKSYIRVGPETKEASEQQFEALVSERNSKVYEIRKWIGQEVLVERIDREANLPQRNWYSLLDCNQHYFVVRERHPNPQSDSYSFPLGRTSICLTWLSGEKRLKLEVAGLR